MPKITPYIKKIATYSNVTDIVSYKDELILLINSNTIKMINSGYELELVRGIIKLFIEETNMFIFYESGKILVYNLSENKLDYNSLDLSTKIVYVNIIERIIFMVDFQGKIYKAFLDDLTIKKFSIGNFEDRYFSLCEISREEDFKKGDEFFCDRIVGMGPNNPDQYLFADIYGRVYSYNEKAVLLFSCFGRIKSLFYNEDFIYALVGDVLRIYDIRTNKSVEKKMYNNSISIIASNIIFCKGRIHVNDEVIKIDENASRVINTNNRILFFSDNTIYELINN